MRELKRPAKGKCATRSRLDGAQNLDTILIPAQLPAQYRGQDHNKESIGNEYDGRVTRLQAALEFSKNALASSVYKHADD